MIMKLEKNEKNKTLIQNRTTKDFPEAPKSR